MSDKHTATYYCKCMIGGSLACGLTHCGINPLDIVKSRRQATPGLYSSTSDGFRKIFAQEGFRGFSLGWFPNLVGYGMQGVVRFGLYEYFKD